MTQYYLPPPPAEGMPASDCIVREDGAWIPPDPANRDWVAYQEWLAEGNTPTEWPEGGPTFVQAPPSPPPTEAA